MPYADALTLDQLRVVLAVADTGSFGDAARSLHRAQGSVSYHVAQIEDQLELQLFERTARRPRITPAGQLVVRHARAVLGRLDHLRAAAHGVRSGAEPRVSLALDVMLPPRWVAALVGRFRARWPTVPLHLSTGILGDVVHEVTSGGADLGIAGDNELPEHLERLPCTSVTLIAVCAPEHPLAALEVVDDSTLDDHVHLVFSGAGSPTALLGTSRGLKWRVTDMGLRLELLRAGLGWARMPRDRVEEDLDAGRLVALTVRRWAGRAHRIDFAVVHDPGRPPGPAALWLIEEAQRPGL